MKIVSSQDLASNRRIAELAGIMQRGRNPRTDAIEDFFSLPIPKTLWHYTTVEAFTKILKSGKIWATEARHTTDTSEFIHARQVAVQYYETRPANTEAERRVRGACLQIINDEFGTGLLSDKQTEVFVASFSNAQDLKSQWIQYAGSSGVSIGFDLSRVRPPRPLGVAVTLAPCIYEKSYIEKLLNAALDHFTGTAEAELDRIDDELWLSQQSANWRLVDRVFNIGFDHSAFMKGLFSSANEKLRVALTLTKFDLLRLASHCKHHFYSEEKEWRLSLAHIKGRPLEAASIHYRGEKFDIPYVSLDLFQDGKLPISEVMLGPECTEVGVSDILDEFGYSVPVSTSMSPERRK